MAPNDVPSVQYHERNQLEPYVTAVVTAVVLLFLLLPLVIQLLQIKVLAGRRASLERERIDKLNSHRLEERDSPPVDRSAMYLCSSAACFDTGREISDLIKYERNPCKKADVFLCQMSSRPFLESQRLLLWQELLRTLHDFGRSTDPFSMKIYSHFHVCRSHGSQSTERPLVSDVAQKRIPQPLGLAEWPVMSTAALPRVSFSAAKLAQIYGIFPLFRVALRLKEGKRYIQVTEPDTIRDMFEMDKYRYKEEALLSFLEKLAEKDPDTENAANLPKRTAVLRGALSVEAKLTQMKHSDEEMCAAPDYAVRSIKDIADSEVWDWEEFLRIVLKDIHEEPITPITIVLFKKRFVNELIELLRKTNMTDVMTFLGMRATLSVLPAMMGDARDEPFLQDVMALRYGGLLEHFCAESTFSLFRFHFLGLLAQRISNGTAHKTVNDIKSVYLNSLLDVFRKGIDSPQAYEMMQKKISDLRINIGEIENTCSSNAECANLYKYVPVMQEPDKYSLMTIALTMVSHVELKLAKEQPGWNDVTFTTKGVLAYDTNNLYFPVHLVNSAFVGEESFMHIGTFGKAVLESLLPAFLHEGMAFYRRGGFSSQMDEATRSRWNLLAECIARGFRGFQRSPNATDPWPNRRPLMQVLLLEAAYKAYHRLLGRLKGSSKTSEKMLRLGESVFIEPDQLFFVLYGWSMCQGDSIGDRSIVREHPARWSIQDLLENNRAFQSAFRCSVIGNSTACIASIF